MQKTIDNARSNAPFWAWLPARVCALGYVAAVCAAGGSLWGCALFALLAVCGVWLPGRVLAGWLGVPQGLVQTASITLGLGLFAGVSALAAATGLHGLVWLLPVLGAAGWLARRRAGCPGVRPGWPGWVWAALAVLCVFACVLPNAHPLAAGTVAPNHDLFWNLGNTKSFLLGLPVQDLRFSGYALTYHFLSELLAAGFAMAGVPAYDALAFLQPVALLAALVLVLRECCAAWFGGGRGTALYFGLTFLCGGAGLWKIFQYGRCPFWNLSVYHIVTNLNGMGLACVLLAAWALFVTALWADANKRPAWLWALAVLALFLLCFAKGPVAGVAVLAFVCAAGVRWLGSAVHRRPCARQDAAVLALSAAGLALFGLVFRFFFSAGAGSSIHFSLLGTLEKSYFTNFVALVQAKWPALLAPAAAVLMLAQAVCFAPAAMPLALLGAVRDVPRVLRLSGRRLLFTAGAFGGFLAFFLFDHESLSQMYFAFIGLFFANALAVERLPGFVAWCTRKRAPGRVALACVGLMAAVGLVGGVCTCVQIVRDGVAAQNGTALRQEWDLPLTADEEQAMAWLAQNMPADALAATNRVHTGKALEGLSNVYSGLSGRRFYMEGFKYAVSNLGVSAEEVAERVQAMKQLFAPDTTPQQAWQLCRDAGITYVVYAKQAAALGWDITEQTQPGLFAEAQVPGFANVFENDAVTIFTVDETPPSAA